MKALPCRKKVLNAVEILDSRVKRLGDSFCYKLAPNQYGMDAYFPDEPMTLDESKMSAWIHFANGQRRDGVGDLLEIGGIKTERHRKNPVVMLDHAKEVSFPIAMACERDANGLYDYSKYTVQLDPIAQSGKCNAFFYQSHNNREHAILCEQIYDMLAKKLLTGGSIGYLTLQAKSLPASAEQGIPQGLHLLSVLMLEASVVVMPANADTVRKALSTTQCCGRPLSKTLVKCLTPYVLSSPECVTSGWEAPEMIVKSLRDLYRVKAHVVRTPPSPQNPRGIDVGPGPDRRKIYHGMNAEDESAAGELNQAENADQRRWHSETEQAVRPGKAPPKAEGHQYEDITSTGNHPLEKWSNNEEKSVHALRTRYRNRTTPQQAGSGEMPYQAKSKQTEDEATQAYALDGSKQNRDMINNSRRLRGVGNLTRESNLSPIDHATHPEETQSEPEQKAIHSLRTHYRDKPPRTESSLNHPDPEQYLKQGAQNKESTENFSPSSIVEKPREGKLGLHAIRQKVRASQFGRVQTKDVIHTGWHPYGLSPEDRDSHQDQVNEEVNRRYSSRQRSQTGPSQEDADYNERFTSEHPEYKKPAEGTKSLDVLHMDISEQSKEINALTKMIEELNKTL